MRLLLNAIVVGTVAGIYPNAISHVDKQWYADLSIAVQLGWLERIGRCIALDSWFGVGDLHLYVRRQLYAENHLFVRVKQNRAIQSILQKLRRVDLVLFHSNLLVGLIVHEVVAHIIIVQVLILARLNTNGFNLHAGVEGVVHNLTIVEILKLGTNEGRAFAWLHVKELDDLPEVVVILHTKPVLNIRSGCHGGGNFAVKNTPCSRELAH